MNNWYYFGCYRQAGHYVFRPGMGSASHNSLAGRLNHFDGMLAPQDSAAGYIAVVSRLAGWGMSALSFWDYTVDKRGKSNSIFFVDSMSITAEALYDGAQNQFPQVWERLPDVLLRDGGMLLRKDAQTGEWLPALTTPL
jgi:hypothetical protein